VFLRRMRMIGKTRSRFRGELKARVFNTIIKAAEFSPRWLSKCERVSTDCPIPNCVITFARPGAVRKTKSGGACGCVALRVTSNERWQMRLSISSKKQPRLQPLRPSRIRWDPQSPHMCVRLVFLPLGLSLSRAQ
jgi:hypothetical protein